MPESSENDENVHITIDNSQIMAGRDASVTGIKKETLVENVGDDAVVTVGDKNVSHQTDNDLPELLTLLVKWQEDMDAKIDALTDTEAENKEDLKYIVARIKAEATKAESADPGRLESLLNSMALMGSDIFEVAVTTLASPLSGIGLVLKKIGEKAKIERQAQQE